MAAGKYLKCLVGLMRSERGRWYGAEGACTAREMREMAKHSDRERTEMQIVVGGEFSVWEGV